MALSNIFLPLLAISILLFVRHRIRNQHVKIITVIDGDTYMAIDKRGVKRKIRLVGADCPELNQRNGPEAKAYAARHIHRKWVKATFLGRDKYRRHLARISCEGQDLAVMLISAGMAYPLGHKGKLQYLSALLQRKGVHSGFGQRRPWQAARGSTWRYWLRRLRK